MYCDTSEDAWLWVGKPDADTLLFGEVDGSLRRPDQLSWLWRSACKSRNLPMVAHRVIASTILLVSPRAIGRLEQS